MRKSVGILSKSIFLSFFLAQCLVFMHVMAISRTMYHPAGTLSMGKVVDACMRVNGVDRLHVVDASVIPVSLAGNLQNCI